MPLAYLASIVVYMPVPNPFPPPPPDWLALIIGGLLQCLGRCVGLNPRGLSGLPNPSLPVPLLCLIRDRLRYFNTRLARHAAGLTTPTVFCAA